MKTASFNQQINYQQERIVTKLILETSFSKEIRILLKSGQVMREHKAPFPIVVHLLEGEIDFAVQDEIKSLQKGDILTLEGNILHELTALQDSIVRLTIAKQDNISRVENAADHS